MRNGEIKVALSLKLKQAVDNHCAGIWAWYFQLLKIVHTNYFSICRLLLATS